MSEDKRVIEFSWDAPISTSPAQKEATMPVKAEQAQIKNQPNIDDDFGAQLQSAIGGFDSISANLPSPQSEPEEIALVDKGSSSDVSSELADFFASAQPAAKTTNLINEEGAPKANVQAPLTLRISDKKTLHLMWIGVFRCGGLFIPKDQLSGRTFRPNETVIFRLSLPDDHERMAVINVRMAWETPAHAEHRMVAGVGFAFEQSDSAEEIRQRAERLLVDMPPSTQNLIFF